MENFKNIVKNLYEKFKEYKNVIALLLLGICLTFIGLSTHSFNIDEIFSLYVSRNWSIMTKTLWNVEANMWLYYLILHFWQLLGVNEFIVRGLSAIFAVASIPVIYLIGKSLFDKKAALISVIFMIFNIFFVITAQLARGYSLSLFLTLLSMYFFIHFEKKRKYKLFYVISYILSVYAHFYALFIILSQVLIAILTKKLRIYFVAFFSVVIFLTPIFLSPSFRSHQVDWIERPTFRNLIGTSYVFSGDFPPLLIIYSLLFFFITPFLIKNIKNTKYIITTTWLFTPVITAFVFSLFVKPIFQSVYFLTSLPPFFILAAFSITKIIDRNARHLFLGAIVVLSILRLTLWYAKDTRYKWVFHNNEDDWRLVTNLISVNARKGDAITFYGYYNRLPYEFYAKKEIPLVIEIASGAYDLSGGSLFPEPNFDLISNLQYKRVWLVLRNSDNGILNRDQQFAEIKKALDEKYREEYVYDFPGLTLFLYILEG